MSREHRAKRGKASLCEAMAEECIRDEAMSLCCELRGYELWCKEVREGIVRPGMCESLQLPGTLEFDCPQSSHACGEELE
jgi:hypothetical protein